MKVYSFDFGGKVREFKYTSAERRVLESRFGVGLGELIQKQVLAVDADGRPTLGGREEQTVALIHAGLKHGGSAVTETRVREWLEAEVTSKGHWMEVVSTACLAVMASGVLGYRYEAPEDEEGKEQPTS